MITVHRPWACSGIFCESAHEWLSQSKEHVIAALQGGQGADGDMYISVFCMLAYTGRPQQPWRPTVVLERRTRRASRFLLKDDLWSTSGTAASEGTLSTSIPYIRPSLPRRGFGRKGLGNDMCAFT